MNAVAGWLLWSHRMSSEFGGMTGRAFAAAARERGVPLSETEVSRAENGEGDVAIAAIAKYERVLGMSVGALSSPLRSAARLAAGAPGSDKLAALRSVPKSMEVRQEVVNDAYVRWSAGERLIASDWLRLMDAITYDRQSLLPDALAAAWIRELLDEGMRSVNAAYFPRIEALSTVAEYDRYAVHLLAAARELTAAPGSSGELEAWSVVGDIRNPAVIDVLVHQLRSVPDDKILEFAVALVMPIQRDDLSHEQAQLIAAELTRRLDHWSLGSYEPVATLAAELPFGLGGPILRRIDQVHPMSRLTGPRVDRDVSGEIATYTRAALANSWPDHPSGSVLPELLRLILSSEHFGLRHHAANLIYCSPFAAAICDAAADLAMLGDTPPARQLATYLVSRLATRENAERLRLLLKQGDRKGLIVNTLTGMAHAGILTEQDDFTPFIEDKDFRYIGIYATGITDHPDLYREIADGDAATWWRSKHGGVWA
ncbi:hypothetical protein [Flexivirga oryzae]|uniref:Uncharacterized protein n=1 Tax=Flexivirga oryzae TaxID=1794944 RepID=A0A839NBM5_9MICO|nr:hypothetical protein [Flexivirga oryzae]MBB2893036.1 hypothetical protein [Flexivirga oryzae]